MIPPSSGRATVKRILHGISLLPLAHIVHLHGKGVRPFLADITGLSPARIAQGNLDKIRPSTAIKIASSSNAWAHNWTKKQGWSDQDFDTHIAAMPLLSNGNPASLASWIYGMRRPDIHSLPLTITHTLKTDELIHSLSIAFDANDCAAFTQEILTMAASEYERSFVRTPAEQIEMKSELDAWRAARDWDAIGALFTKVADNLLLDIYAALDAEWGGWYFQAATPKPVFLFINPQMNKDIDMSLGTFSSGTIPSRNLVYRPVRRLLELSYAVLHCNYKGHWPDEPVGRKELGQAIDLADSHIGNYFDGTRNLTLTAFQNIWQSLCRNFAKNSKEPEGVICPAPLAVVAIAWQHMFIQNTNEHKLKSVFMLDETDYTRRWQHHRNCWADQLTSGDFDWPVWLLNKSL
jgi:hypothetical protein